MNAQDLQKIHDIVNRVYHVYHRREFIGFDPVGLLEPYTEKEDREIVALIAALLAFGRVEQINEKVRKVLNLMHPSPREWIEYFDPEKWQHIDFYHRFVKWDDLLIIFAGIKKILDRWGSLETCFEELWKKSEYNLHKTIGSFRATLIENNGYLKSPMFLPDPAKKSPCKRWMLFLRWMVRRDEIDPGGWMCLAPKYLIVPVDVHMERVASKLELSSCRSISWRLAVEITESLKQLDPEDPVKYDFSLTRWSMDNFPDL